MTKAIKKHGKLDLTFLKYCPILPYLFILCQIFCPGLYLGAGEQTNRGKVFFLTNFKYTVRALRVNETNFSLTNAFVADLFTLKSVRE